MRFTALCSASMPSSGSWATRYSSVRLQVESRTASEKSSDSFSSRRTCLIRLREKLNFSRTSTGAVLWFSPNTINCMYDDLLCLLQTACFDQLQQLICESVSPEFLSGLWVGQMLFYGFPLFVKKCGEGGHVVAVLLLQIFQQQVGEAWIASCCDGKQQVAVFVGSGYGKIAGLRIVRNVYKTVVLRCLPDYSFVDCTAVRGGHYQKSVTGITGLIIALTQSQSRKLSL